MATDHRWSRKQVSSIRADLRAELDAEQARAGIRGRLRHCLLRIRALEDDTSSDALLRSYSYVCSALVHHVRHGGLALVDVRRLARVAARILKLQGISSFDSPLAFLYADVESLVAQCFRREGLHWEACWHTQLTGVHRARGEAATPLHLLASGNRFLRLGQVDAAVDAFQTAARHRQARIGIVEAATIGWTKALRLSGADAAALATIQQADPAPWTDAGRLELSWERACLSIRQRRDLRPLVELIRRRDLPLSYRLEAYLYQRSTKPSQHAGLALRLPGVLRRQPPRQRTDRDLAAACRLVDSLHDTEIPFPLRLQGVAALDRHCRAQFSLDRELLLLAASAAWLRRRAPPLMAEQVAFRYRTLSWAISDGRHADALGILPT